MSDVHMTSPWNALLSIVVLILFVILIMRCYRYAREFDRYLRRRYPDIVEQLKRNYPSWTLNRGLAPLFSVSLIESDVVKDEKLRGLRRKAICSLLWVFLVMASFSVLLLLFDW